MLRESRLQKILLVSHEMSYTGAPRSLLNIAVILKSEGYLVEVWTLQTGLFSREFEKEGIRITVLPEEKRQEEEVKKYKFVILNTIFTAYLAPRFQKFARTILYIREAQNIPYLVRKCGINPIDICATKEILCVSEYAAKFILANYPLKQLNVLHNYVIDSYHGELNLRRRGKVHFLLSGTYEKRKGHDIVVAAFLKMPDELKRHSCLHIVGQKPEWSKEFWSNVELTYDDRIVEHGEITDRGELMKLYRRMNVFVIASRDESCSLVALEGAMLGKSLIMSENVGAQYLDKRQKMIYPTEDIDALCRKMCEMTSRKKNLLCGIEMRRAYKRTSTRRRYVNNLRRIIERNEESE